MAAATPSDSQRDDRAGDDVTARCGANAIEVASAPAVSSTLNAIIRAETAALPNAAANAVGHTPSCSAVGPSMARPNRISDS